MAEDKKASGRMESGVAVRLGDLVEVGAGAVVSRTLEKGPAGTLTVFAFDEGQELSEHSAPFDAYVTVLAGTVQLVIGGEPVMAGEGETVLMPANVPHAVYAKTPLKMLLTMIKN